MYHLIDEILIPNSQEKRFVKLVPQFSRLYKSIKGVTSVRYCKVTLEAFKKQTARELLGIGARHLRVTKNPKDAYLLIIIFKSQKYFQEYHDNSKLSKEIHQKISGYFGGRQLTIRAALHGEEL